MQLLIQETGLGNYTWELHHGPDGAFVDIGVKPTLEDCIKAVHEAEHRLARDLCEA